MAGMSRAQIVNTRNRILSQNIQMTLDTRHTDLNNNILVIGGSGSGKTYRFVEPQLMQMSSSFIITDPKGELYRDTSGLNNSFTVSFSSSHIFNVSLTPYSL